MLLGTMLGDLNRYGGGEPQGCALTTRGTAPEVDGNRVGAVGFCRGGSVLTCACKDWRLNRSRRCRKEGATPALPDRYYNSA